MPAPERLARRQLLRFQAFHVECCAGRTVRYTVGMHVRTTAAELARWLDQHRGPWTVEGEPVLLKTLPVPTPGAILADALRKRGGELQILAPDVGAFLEDARIGHNELHDAAFDVDGNRVFQLSWIEADGTTKDAWLLCEADVLARSGQTLITPPKANNIMDVLQHSRVTVPRMRKG